MKKVTKIFLLVHRYLGIALSLLFVIWFLSGFAMMYVKYPTMRQNERLQQLPVVDLSSCKLSLSEALNTAGISDTLRTIRLGMMLDRPVYRLTTNKGEYKAVFADTGELFKKTDTTLAIRLAGEFENETKRPEEIEILTEIDQWMAAARSQGYTTPVYRLKMVDQDDTYIYVSMQTGEVVQRVTARQRFLAWLGPIPHWIYPTVLLRNRPIWNDIIIWTSTLGTLMCMAGIAMGMIRYKRRDKTSMAFSPYKKKWFRWHHYTGFVFGIFAFTWVFSGLLSMTPWDWAPFTKLTPEESDQWNGGPINPSLFSLSPANAAKLIGNQLLVKEIQFLQIDGKPFYVAYQDEFHTRLLNANVASSKPFEIFPAFGFTKKIGQLNPNANITESRILNAYDDYYYSKTHDKRLPVLRVKTDLPEKTWYYVDLKTGQVVLKHEKLSRLERWLYHGLHSLDFSFIFYKRPLWDIVMIVLMIGGLFTSGTGLVLSWKWAVRRQPKFLTK